MEAQKERLSGWHACNNEGIQGQALGQGQGLNLAFDSRPLVLPLLSQLPSLETVAQFEIASVSEEAAASKGRKTGSCNPY